jgi:PHD/YefM family antitoxin component YafN of YafNO toxin-antitoxin module
MPNLTATEAKKHFGKMLDDAKRDPVFIWRDGKLSHVVVSWDAFKRVIDRNQPEGVRPIVEELLAKSIEKHHNLYVALSKLD